jgi:hypothetical protein
MLTLFLLWICSIVILATSNHPSLDLFGASIFALFLGVLSTNLVFS